MAKVSQSINSRATNRESRETREKYFSIATLGCKVNAFESEQIAAQLIASGRRRINNFDAAGVCIINTCSVTAEADRQARQLVRRAVRKSPGARVIVTGCYAQLEAQTCAQIPGVDLVVGNPGKANIPSLLAQLESGENLPAVVMVEEDEVSADADGLTSANSDKTPPPLPVSFDGRTRAYLQIQQGCDRGCTFCIIHKARGASRSLPAKIIREQARQLINNGHRELVLCGVDIGAYGDDFAADDENKTGAHDHLAKLLQQLAAIDGDFRLRISSIDPAHLSDQLIAQIAESPRICPQLHLSLQSGNTLILKRMKRRATREIINARINALRAAVPHAVLSADILVGFPTESDAHFDDTLNAVAELEIAYPHVFAYSPRPNTPAARIPSQVPPPLRKHRAAVVRELGREVWRKVAARQVGLSLRVLVEKRAADSADVFARADNYFPVRVAAKHAQSGDWLQVMVESVAEDALIAKLIDSRSKNIVAS